MKYRYDIITVQFVLEEMDIYIFNKPEQFFILIPLLEEYILDFLYWEYCYKLKHWKVKRATVNKNGDPLKEAKNCELYASYRLCQAILEHYFSFSTLLLLELLGKVDAYPLTNIKFLEFIL